MCNVVLQKLVAMFPVVLITGPRQVGKTSLLRKYFPEAAYLTLDIPSVAEQAENSPDLLFNNLETPVIFDEIQYAPALFRHLKVAIDQHPERGQYLLTGSQNFQMMQGVSESLSGRCGILTLSGLSTAEIRAYCQATDLEIMMTGGYPQLWAEPQFDRELWYAGYLATYLERDIRNILQVGHLRDFERFLRSAAIRTGQMLSFSDLARDVGIAVSTARQWMSVLQASGQVMLLEPYHRNLGKRLVKTPKLYFTDVGLVLYLCGIETLKQLLVSPLLGAFYETFVMNDIVKAFSNAGKQVPLWFWRNQAGHEVDLVIDRGGQYALYEIKLAQTPTSADLTGIQAFTRMYGEQHVTSAAILCRTPQEFRLSGVRVMNIIQAGVSDFLV